MNCQVSLRARVGDLDLDVSFESGRRAVALVGPNGCGKSTLLRMVAGAYGVSHGRIALADRVLLDTGAGVDLPPEARRIGYLPQGAALFPHLSVVDNVRFGLRSQHGGARPGDAPATAEGLLASLGAEALAERSVRDLSGGERQRVALARALAVRPSWLLLDEPFTAIDVASRRALRKWLSSHITQHGTPVLFATHDLRDVSALDADVVVLEAGAVVRQGTLAELRAAPGSAFVEEFVAVHADASTRAG